MKRLYKISILLFLLLLVPAVFAEDNETAVLTEDTADAETLSISQGDVLTASNDYYFNASAPSDGDGSISSPYKYLYNSRIRSNCNLHFANGEYSLDSMKYIDEVNIIGSDVDKTVINFDGVIFTVNTALTVKNVTFVGSSITNHARFEASNTVFRDGYGSKPDDYGNNFGGAIYTYKDNANAYVKVDNCTFRDNYAEYGGAIYMGAGVLEVTNSRFYDNWAKNYGGAIACERIANVTVSNSKFYGSRSLGDAGGCIYVKSSKFYGKYIDIANSTATFGAAITTLNTTAALTNLNLANNSAAYDGGAIFHMYCNFSLTNSILNNNSARNGGALFIDNSTGVFVRSCKFTNNRATDTAGAVYSILNRMNSPYRLLNTYSSNRAAHENDIYEVSRLDLFIGNGTYEMYAVDTEEIGQLPSRYSSVEQGYTTAVKDQQTSGNCWAFTAIAVLESAILKASGEEWDLSEENMKNIIELYSDYGWKMDTNEGGYDYMPWGYLASWLGPVDEMDDLFDDKSTLSAVLNSLMHVQNIKIINRYSPTDNDAIKRAVMDYGAVGTGIYYDSYYFDDETNAFYCWKGIGGNHAVTIVGWDDTFSRSNFKWGSYAEGDGAWIVRNSWGPNWGDDGYFYVSYYDANFAMTNMGNPAYTFILNDTVRYDRNYQYDIGGITDYFLNSSSTVWYKNVFTSISDEYLAAVSTYFEKISDFTASVYVNGVLKDVISGKSDIGYYTFNLNRLISLAAGDVFEVVFNITVDGEAAFPVSEVFRMNKLTYSPGVSYVSYDGESWQDLYNLTWAYSTHHYESQTAAIKAFTVLNEINTFTSLSIEFDEDEAVLNITAFVEDEYGNPVRCGNVTFDVNGFVHIAEVLGGRATFLYEVSQRTNSISAGFESEGYVQSGDSRDYTVPKINVGLDLEIIQSYNNADIIITANRMINETVTVDINGNVTSLALANGTRTVRLENLSNDIYTINVTLPEESDYKSDELIREFEINLVETLIVSDNLTMNDEGIFEYNVTLLDADGRPVGGSLITFVIGNSTYENTTDDEGMALIYLSLNRGVYDINTSFGGDNGHFKSSAQNTVNVKALVVLAMDISVSYTDAFISLSSSKFINDTFTVLINDRTNYTESKNGFASLKLYNLSSGLYNVSVTLNEDEYEFNTLEGNFTISAVKICPEVAVSDENVSINVVAENATGNITIFVDGIYNSVELNESIANCTIKNMAAGNHSYVIVHEPSGAYAYATFNVPKRQSSISLAVNSTKIGEKSVIVVDVTRNATGNVMVDVNGTEYLVNLSRTNNLTITLTQTGQYPVSATYLGDDNYNSSVSEQKMLAVEDKLPANITIELPDDVRVNRTVSVAITKDTSSDFTVYIDGEIHEGDEFTFMKAGLHTIEVRCPENSDYYGENRSATFNVYKNDANISLNLSDGIKVGQTIDILPETDSDGALNVTVNGEPVDSSYVIPFKGSFVIVVETEETETYNHGFKMFTFTAEESVIAKEKANITVDVPDGASEGQTVNIVVNVENATGNVSIIVDGIEYGGVLNESSSAGVVLENISWGNHSVVVIYSGDEKHNSSFKSDMFSVLANDVTEPADPNMGIDVGDGIVVIELPDDASGIVTVRLDGRDIYNGLANVSRKVSLGNLSCGDHIVAVVYSGDENYTGDYRTLEFSIPKAETSISAVPVEMSENETANMTVEISCVESGIVLVDINGRKFYGNINEGEAVISIFGLQAGDYMADILFAGDERNNGSYGNVTIKVNAREEPAVPEPDNNVTVIVDGVEYNGTVVDGRVVIDTEPVVFDDNVTVVVDGVEYNGTVVDGRVVIDTEPVVFDNNVTVVVNGVEYNGTVVDGRVVIDVSVVEPDNNVTVIVDGVEYNGTVVDGRVVIDTEPVVSDSNVTVIVDGIEYNGTVVDGVVVIDTEPVVFDDNVTVIVDGVEYSGTVVDGVVVIDTEPVVFDDNVTVVVNGVEYSGTLVDGRIVIDVSVVEPDNNVTVIVNGESYPAVIENGTVVIDVPVIEPDKNVTVIVDGVVYPAELINGTVNVKTNASEPVDNVTVIVDGVSYPCEVVNGTVIVETNASEVDGNVTVIVDGVVYPAELINGTVIVETNASELDNNITVVIDGVVYPAELINGTVIVETNASEVDGNVTVIVDGVVYSAELINGTVIVETNASDLDNNITVVIDGVAYPAQLINGTVIVETNDSKPADNVTVVVDGISYPGEVIDGVVTIKTDAGEQDWNVTVIVDDVPYAAEIVNGTVNVKTNASEPVKNVTVIVDGVSYPCEIGNGIISIKTDAGEPADVNVVVNGVSYPAKIINGTVTVKTDDKINNTVTLRLGTELSADDFVQYSCDYYAGERGGYFTAQLMDSNGNPLADKTVLIGYNGVNFMRTTNETGWISVQIGLQNAGLYTFAMSYLGDDNYNASFLVKGITIVKKPTSISAKNKVFKAKAKTKKLTVTLKTIAGSSIDGKVYLREGKKLTLKINGKKYTAMTGADGKATFKITGLNKKAIYRAKISFAGDQFVYNKSTKKIYVTVK